MLLIKLLLLATQLQLIIWGQEISCGRNEHKKPMGERCHCEVIKKKVVQDEMAKCFLIKNQDARRECYANVPDCREVQVIERESENPKGMPIQCKRYCSTAKCGCCNS